MKKRLIAVLLIALSVLTACTHAEGRPYSKVYEPETSVVLPAAVAWKSDGSAISQDAPPGIAMVRTDAQLKVYAADGALIDESLPDYIAGTSDRVIPALYICDPETADALEAYLKKSELRDVFVVADRENAHLVKQVAQLPHVRGMVDFRSIDAPDEAALEQIVRTTNASFAKVALLSESAATEDNVRWLQRRLITVWAEAGNTLSSLLGACTSGVNGMLVSDYAAAYEALAFFADDAPTLLRVPNIIGHRGMPSEQVENTLESALAARDAGADSIEVDIYLSADNELFITHDAGMERLFNREDIADVEKMTLAELQQIPFSSDEVNGVQVRNHTPAAQSRCGEIRLDPAQRIPALEAVFDVFDGADTPVDTEIKSKNPEIVSALKDMVQKRDNFADLFVITFNTAILDTMTEQWPEISVGALSTQGDDRSIDRPYYADYAKIIERKGVEKALEMLYGEIDRWNATFNPNKNFSYELAVAGRHRGLTVWPWTYNDPAEFAQAYLNGLYGLTTNFAWWASDFVVDLRAEDVSVAAGGPVPPPAATTQSGAAFTAGDAELIVIEGALDRSGEALCIYRLKQTLRIDGTDYGEYYLYSNPFAVTVTA